MAQNTMTPREFAAVLKAAGLSKVEAAKAIGVDLRTIYRWLTGDTRISVAYAALVRERLPVAFQNSRSGNSQ